LGLPLATSIRELPPAEAYQENGISMMTPSAITERTIGPCSAPAAAMISRAKWQPNTSCREVLSIAAGAQ